MITNTEITKLKNEIDNFEKSINKINFIILVVKNYELVNIYKNSITTKNNIVVRKQLIDHMKSIESIKDYKIQYILKFIINKSLEELNSTINLLTNLEDCYKIMPLTSLNNITFSETETETETETEKETELLNNIFINKKTNSFASINSLIIIVTK